MEDNNQSFSPFDSPVKEPSTIRSSETSGGIKMEQIHDSELDGSKNPPPGNSGGGGGDAPQDAPVFDVPSFNDVPDAKFGDPNAPGSSPGGGGPSPNSGGSGGGGNAGDGTKVEPGFMKEFSDFSAKWLVDIFFRLLVGAFRQFAKIDKAEVVKAVDQGSIDPRFLTFVDEANDKVEKGIYVTDDEKKFVIEPLKYFLEVKKIQLKPEWMFITGLLFVGGNLGLRAWDMKQQNKELLDHMMKESAKWREKDRAGQPAASGRGQGGGRHFYENVENFSPSPSAPAPASSNIEVVETEEVDNDDNA